MRVQPRRAAGPKANLRALPELTMPASPSFDRHAPQGTAGTITHRISRQSIVSDYAPQDAPEPPRPQSPPVLADLPVRAPADIGDAVFFGQHPLPAPGLAALAAGAGLPGGPDAAAFREQLQRLHASVGPAAQDRGPAARALDALLDRLGTARPPSRAELWAALVAHLGRRPLALEVVLQQFQGSGDATAIGAHLPPFVPDLTGRPLQARTLETLLTMAASAGPHRESVVDALRAHLTHLQQGEPDETPALHALRVRRLFGDDGPAFSQAWQQVYPGVAEPEEATPRASVRHLGRYGSWQLLRNDAAWPFEPPYALVLPGGEALRAFSVPGVDGTVLHLAQDRSGCVPPALNTVMTARTGEPVILSEWQFVEGMARRGVLPGTHFDLFEAVVAANERVPAARLTHCVMGVDRDGGYRLDDPRHTRGLVEAREAAVSFHHQDAQGVIHPHVVALVFTGRTWEVVDPRLAPPRERIPAADLPQALRRYFEAHRADSRDARDNTIEVVYPRHAAAPR